MDNENVTIKQGISGGWVAFIVLVVLIIGGGLGYWYATKYKNNTDTTVSPTPTASVSSSSTSTSSPTPSTSTSWKNVNFSKYGFSLTLTDNWQGYKYTEEIPNDSSAVKWIRFYVPTTDPDYANGGMPGYDNPFVISVYTKDQWAAVDMSGPHDTYIGENANYVIAYSRWQACAKDLCDKISNADLTTVKNSIKVQ